MAAPVHALNVNISPKQVTCIRGAALPSILDPVCVTGTSYNKNKSEF